MKRVEVYCHSFDCLPGHVIITSSGTGSNLRVAICDAVRGIFRDKRLKRKHIGQFKMGVVAIREAVTK